MKKKILSLCLVLAMAAIAVVGGTMAYFTDTDEETNVFTAGNVKIIQNEKDRNGNDYGDDTKRLYPIVNDAKDDQGYHTGENYIDKIVTVTNNGTELAYVRTFVAFPAELDDGDPTFDAGKNILHWNGASANDTFTAANPAGIDNDWYWCADRTNDWPTASNGAAWNCFQTEVDDVLYNVYVATHKAAVNPGATTAPSLLGVYLDKNVDNRIDDDGNVVYTIPREGADEDIDFDITNTKILVATQAVQAQGFDNAWDALDEAFGEVGSECPFDGTIQK